MGNKKIIISIFVIFLLSGCEGRKHQIGASSQTIPRLNVPADQSDADYDLMVRCSVLHQALAVKMESINKSGDLFEENFRAFTSASMLVLLSNGYQGKTYSAELAKNKFTTDFNSQIPAFVSSISIAPGGEGVSPGQANNHLMGQCGRLTNTKNYKEYYEHLVRHKKNWDLLMNK
jgi:hypothetical protein